MKAAFKALRHHGKTLFGAAAAKVRKAREAKERKRNGAKSKNSPAKKSNSVSVMHKGKRVFGIVAQRILAKRAERAKGKNGAKKKKRNLDHRDAQHPIEVSRYWQGRKGYETQWQRAHKGGQKQLFPMNPKRKGGKKRNAPSAAKALGKSLFNSFMPFGFSNPDGLNKAIDDFVEFQGRPPESVVDLEVPDGSPNNLALCGEIPEIELEDGRVLKFSKSEGDRPQLLRRGNRLYIASEGFRWSQPGEIGFIKRIDYITTKAHINDGERVHYYHFHGEEGGTLPRLVADDERMFKVVGGSYYITHDGIRD